MARSQNGWPASASSSDYVPLRWVTGRVAPGDIHAILDHLGARFHAEVEPIDRASSWGWAYRAIRGADENNLSNHASGTAVDFNAPRHPLGKAGTFTPAQVQSIRRILADLGDVIRWGGDYSGRKDEMHFEVWADPLDVARVARNLKTPTAPKPPPPPEDDDVKPTEWDAADRTTVRNLTFQGVKPTEWDEDDRTTVRNLIEQVVTGTDAKTVQRNIIRQELPAILKSMSVDEVREAATAAGILDELKARL